MAQSYLLDQKRVLPVAAYLQGEYGFHDLYAGVPVILGQGGVERILELALDATEAALFEASVRGVADLLSTLKNNKDWRS